MRVAHPCSENLPGMSRTPGGVHCSRCERDVLDLRRVPRKRALAVLAEARAADVEGRVCAWVRATEDGTPVFAPEPSRWSRFAAPALVATTLAACSVTGSEPRAATPIAFVQPPEPTPPAQSSGGNTNAIPAPLGASASVPRQPIQPASNVQPVTVEMAGDMAF